MQMFGPVHVENTGDCSYIQEFQISFSAVRSAKMQTAFNKLVEQPVIVN